VHLRAEQAVATGPHDTRIWVRLASDPGRFGPAATLFDRAEPLWQAGLWAENWLTPLAAPAAALLPLAAKQPGPAGDRPEPATALSLP
jgi:hypothetical protein